MSFSCPKATFLEKDQRSASLRQVQFKTATIYSADYIKLPFAIKHSEHQLENDDIHP